MDRHPTLHGPAPTVVEATTLEGSRVVNTLGEELGEIEAVVLDIASGSIAYAVLLFDDMLGFGGKFFAIPWPALKHDAAGECFVLDATRERLEAAPGFDKDNWPETADETFASMRYSESPDFDDPLSASSG